MKNDSNAITNENSSIAETNQKNSINTKQKEKCSITTFDNPFSPFSDFENWFLFDIENHYYTCNKLARLSKVDDSMTDKEETEAVERAIDRLIEIDPLDIYKKVYESDYKAASK